VPRPPQLAMSTLVQLTAVRSQLALGLEAYLQAFVEMTAWPVVRFPGVRVLADVYLPPDVISRSELDADALARRQAADERGEFGHAEERVRRVAWAEERSRVERAVVLGRPGEGKTALTQMSCRAVATERSRYRSGSGPRTSWRPWRRSSGSATARLKERIARR